MGGYFFLVETLTYYCRFGASPWGLCNAVHVNSYVLWLGVATSLIWFSYFPTIRFE